MSLKLITRSIAAPLWWPASSYQVTPRILSHFSTICPSHLYFETDKVIALVKPFYTKLSLRWFTTHAQSMQAMNWRGKGPGSINYSKNHQNKSNCFQLRDVSFSVTKGRGGTFLVHLPHYLPVIQWQEHWKLCKRKCSPHPPPSIKWPVPYISSLCVWQVLEWSVAMWNMSDPNWGKN